ncbi:DUF2955 domain-containing protein [Candidatus Colwellia aromaticivorans]|uniref:DUF2955 domain-containing protein n=1 Tax=Candidatus Colwellia aromaticivorans TaxID=2267621 RepID=UPI000DF14A4B|nr:DUF2955 domain-containing protein [Candidatus Colwellia aromaticivorans]
MNITLANLLPHTITNLTQREIRILRFFIGVLFAIVLAYVANWPFAFITPIFVAKFLGSSKGKLSFKKLVAILLIIVSAFILGGIITRLLLPFPIVFILIMTLLIFWISYWNNSGGNELVITMLLVGFTVIPMMGLLHQDIAHIFTVGFLFSCFVSLVITMLMHELIVDKEIVNDNKKLEENKLTEQLLAEKPERVKFAILSTLMIMPVMIFFFAFNLSSSVLILAFIALLAQKPDLVAGIKGSKALLVGNTIGGLVAIAMYNLLTLAPDFIFLVLLFSCVVISFAQAIFSEKPMVPLYAMAFTTVIILVFGATLSTSDADEKFYTRIVQIACACSYVVFATVVASPLIKKITQA